MANKILDDERIDQRIKEVFGQIDMDSAITHFSTREEMMAFEQTEEAMAAKGLMEMINNADHYKELMPSDGLVTVTKEFLSQPDGNTIPAGYAGHITMCLLYPRRGYGSKLMFRRTLCRLGPMHCSSKRCRSHGRF